MAQEVNADGTPAPLAFVPAVGTKNCTDMHAWGEPSVLYSYIFKGNADPDKYPEDACRPWIHETAQIDSLQVNTSIVGIGSIVVTGPITSATEVTANGVTLTSRKSFDILHPTKENHRLRHVCLEGPESAVYVRGRLTGNNVIELPDYWKGLVDPESITVSLTQIGSSQDLIVERIEWGSRVVVRSGSASNIDCYYLIHGERKDGEKLIVEYEGDKISDYPGDNRLYTHNK